MAVLPLPTALAALPPGVLLALTLGALLGVALLGRRALGREGLYRAVFEADTWAGRAIDALLLGAILLSVLAVVLESEPWLRTRWATAFTGVEWGFTLLFTLEYLLRLLSVERPLGYAISFFGLVDLLSILPTYLGLFLAGGQVFLVVRALRLLRTFRVLKLGAYLQESELLWTAILSARRKIGVFLLAIVVLVLVIGALMYVIEGPASAFRSIPVGIYWAVVTITTVGYGDVAPVTPLGRCLASAVMLLGYSIIAVPTGIITTELGAAAERRRERRADRPTRAARRAANRIPATGPASSMPSTIPPFPPDPQAPPFSRESPTTPEPVCGSCGGGDHDADALYCKHCGARL